MDEQPIDYIAAALVYMMYDDAVFQEHHTVDGFTVGLNDQFKSGIPEQAVHSALTLLVAQKMVKVVSSRFAQDYYYAASPFGERVAQWRSARADQSAIVYDNFMNGPSHWMKEAFGSAHFMEALDEQLTPIEEDAEGSSAAARTLISQGSVLVERIDEALLALDSADVGNAEKAQAHALLSASKALAEAPEPPVNVIWDLIQRANNIAGIASLLVALIALFASH